MAPALEDLLAKELSTLSTAAEVVDDDVNIKLVRCCAAPARRWLTVLFGIIW